MKNQWMLALGIILLSCGGSTTSSEDGSDEITEQGTGGNNQFGACSLDSSNPDGSEDRSYCDKIFDEDSISMTTYKYATAPDASGGDDVNLYMDVYFPTSNTDTDRPMVIWLHAGGGERDDSDPVNWCTDKFARRGYVCASIDYRDSEGTAGFTANDQMLAITDAQSAIRFAREKANLFGIDPNKMILMGKSAGALTAASAAVTGNDNDDDYFDDSNINTDNSGQPSWSCVSVTLSGAVNGQAMHLVDANDPANFAYHGGLDTTVPYSQAVETVDTMNQLNIPSTLMTFEDKAHNLGNADVIEADLFPQLYDWVIAAGCPHDYMSQDPL